MGDEVYRIFDERRVFQQKHGSKNSTRRNSSWDTTWMFSRFSYSLICSVIVLGIISHILWRDPVIQEITLDETCAIQAKADTGWWEMCMWVYLKIQRKGIKTVRSAPIICYEPDVLEA